MRSTVPGRVAWSRRSARLTRIARDSVRGGKGVRVGEDWARPVVHWEIVADDPDRQASFYRQLFHWEIGDGPIAQITPGIGGPEPGPGGHIRRGAPAVVLYVQVRELRASLERVRELGGTVTIEPFDVPGGPTLAGVEDPEGNALMLVQQ